jgi:hypothetical protein
MHYCHWNDLCIVTPTTEWGYVEHAGIPKYHPELVLLFLGHCSPFLCLAFCPPLPSCCKNAVYLVHKKCSYDSHKSLGDLINDVAEERQK